MIRRAVGFALTHKLFVIAIALLLMGAGIVAFKALPIDAYPDVADNYVEIVTQWAGISAEQMEQQITIPLEIVMNGIPQLSALRSFSLFGLSDIKLIFEDGSDNNWNRERALERISYVNLPPAATAAGVVPQIQTDWSPAGQIYFFTLRTTNPQYDPMDLKSIEDWVVEKNFKQVQNIVDVASFGGPTREYQVRIDPNKLISYGLSLSQIESQISNNNANAGGSFVDQGLQQVNVNEGGLVRNINDLANTVVSTAHGTPIRLKDIAVVAQGPKIRLGQFARATHRADGKIIDNDDVISGIVLLRKGDDADPALAGIHKKVEELNNGILPPGVKVVPMIDRSDLVHFTTDTVLHNLQDGFILVTIVLILFLGNVRAAIIVALTIPFALLFAAICLDINHIPANLLSLGALDFGMVVDGAIVMVENIVRHLGQREGTTKSVAERIRDAAHEVQRPVFYAITIIITAYLPIFTLQRVEGRLFRPMAWTVGFALLGAVVFSLTIAPVLASFFFRKGTREWQNPVVVWLTAGYRRAVTWTVHHKWAMIAVALMALAGSAYLAGFLPDIGIAGLQSPIGSEFLPHLDEGALWVRGTLPPSTSAAEAIKVSTQARIVLCSFPEVPQCSSQEGRPDDGSDTTSFFNTEYFVDLKPKAQWRPVFHQDRDLLIAAMNRELEKIPGAIWNFSQPISDNMEEAVSGVKGQLSTKVYGDDLHVLEDKAEEIMKVMSKVPGIEDLGVFHVLGQPNLIYTVDRQAAARFQINVADIQDAIQTAVGGNALTQVLQGERRYDLVMRYLPEYRDTREAIQKIRLLSPSGERVSLAQLTTQQELDGGSEIYREASQRYVPIKYSVRGRDLGGAVGEAIEKVKQQVKLPFGYHLSWEGEYQSEVRAEARLKIIIPLTVFIIFLIIYGAFGSAKWACLHLVNVLVSRLGGLMALLITATHFSVSSGVGFMALFGASIQTGVIMVEYINQLRSRGMPIVEAAIEGAVRRFRPIMMTMLVATLGLLPAALSHKIGSDSQRPFAIVIVGGLIFDLLMSIFLLPTFYAWWARPTDHLPPIEESRSVYESGEEGQ